MVLGILGKSVEDCHLALHKISEKTQLAPLIFFWISCTCLVRFWTVACLMDAASSVASLSMQSNPLSHVATCRLGRAASCGRASVTKQLAPPAGLGCNPGTSTAGSGAPGAAAVAATGYVAREGDATHGVRGADVGILLGVTAAGGAGRFGAAARSYRLPTWKLSSSSVKEVKRETSRLVA